MEQPSNRLFRCRWLQDRIPLAHREELYHILTMMGPLLMSKTVTYTLPFVVTVFCGRLGNDVIAGYGLAFSVLNITAITVGYGLSLACDTLVSQTFGSENLKRVGLILQRSILIVILFCLPFWGLLINSEAILLRLGLEPGVVRIAQVFIMAYLPSLPAFILYSLQVSYLQNQGIIFPQVYCSILAVIAEVATNYILIDWLEMGVVGSAVANSLSYVYLAGFLATFIWWRKLHVATWGGWSRDCLQEWGSFMKLAIPSAAMVFLEATVYDLGAFFAGMMNEDELAAHHSVVMISFLMYMVPFSIQGAACARVGNALGAGDTSRAILISKLSLYLAAVTGGLVSILLACIKNVLGYMFSYDENFAELVSHILTALCLLQLSDSIGCVCKGIFLGVGKQMIPAWGNFFMYYFIGLALSLVFMFVMELGIFGFWLGLLIGTIVQCPVFITIIFRKLNWKTLTEEAVERAQKKAQSSLLSRGAENQTADDEKLEDGHVSVYRNPAVGRLSNKQLLVRRGLVILGVFGILSAGLCTYFLVPLPLHFVSNSTLAGVNTTLAPDQLTTTVVVSVTLDH